MRTESRPTRAEVSDAAGAVDAGADAIMLSGETAIGDHPVRAVEVLDSIIRHAEAVPPPWMLPVPSAERPDHFLPLCDAAVTLATRGHVDGIVVLTREGRTARLLAARRPDTPITRRPTLKTSRAACACGGVVDARRRSARRKWRRSDRPDRRSGSARRSGPANASHAWSSSARIQSSTKDNSNFVRIRTV